MNNLVAKRSRLDRKAMNVLATAQEKHGIRQMEGHHRREKSFGIAILYVSRAVLNRLLLLYIDNDVIREEKVSS